MIQRVEGARILMYSHDTFGLGHLRRCRTIAHSLVEDFRGLNILIISGATIAGAFDYRARVDFVKSSASSNCATANTPRSSGTSTCMKR
jgi:predicted glycosyltransferase